MALSLKNSKSLPVAPVIAERFAILCSKSFTVLNAPFKAVTTPAIPAVIPKALPKPLNALP